VKLRSRLLFEWLLVAGLSVIAVILAHQWRGTESFDNLLYDQLSGLLRPKADDNILIVGIDDRSLAALGQWPWPRKNHARLISVLTPAKPRAVLLDVLLSEAGNAEDDQALADAMKNGPPVFIPLHFVTPGSEGRKYDTVSPIPAVSEQAAGIGHVNVEFDSDGRVRRVALCFNPDDKLGRWPHLIELMARKHQRVSNAYRRLSKCSQTLLIPYAKRGTYAETSFVDAINGGIPAKLVEGRDVIVGATAVGMGDSYPVPFGDGGLLSGAEIMANILAAIKRDNFVQPAPHWMVIAVSILISTGLLIAFLFLRPRTALIVSLLLVSAILIASALGLAASFWFPPGAALLGILLIYPLWGWRRLQALSTFMAGELGQLEKEGAIIPFPQKRDVATDIVGRQSALLAGAIDNMRDLRRFVADTIEHMPDPLMVSDLNGIVTLTNDLLDERLGRDVTGTRLSKVMDDIVDPSNRALVDTFLSHVTNPADKGEHDGQEFIRFRSRRNRVFVMRTGDIRTDAGQLRGHIHYLTDITDLAQAEQDREVALQLLSHDMRAPQSAIIALLPRISNKDMSIKIEGYARRTMQLAQDFVDIARMGESDFDGIDILLADLVRDVAENFWPIAEERGVSIEVDDQSDAAFIFGEPDSLTRAFANLFDNAVKYSPENSAITARITRSTAVAGNSIIVTIEDEGVGIDPKIAERLFQRFASDRSDATRVKGIGLGLSFVKAVIDKHRGTVSGENRETGGARFIITFPEAPEPEENV
jgi:PAS domain S-box-containing protein